MVVRAIRLLRVDLPRSRCARRSHAQEAGYLAFLDAWGDWNPSDFAVHLTRRSRGLPFWFSLAVHGTQAYSNAIDITMDLAVYAGSAGRRGGAPDAHDGIPCCLSSSSNALAGMHSSTKTGARR